MGSLKKFFSVTLRESTPAPRLVSPSPLNHPVCFQNGDQKLFSDVSLVFTGKKENSSLLKKKKNGMSARNHLKCTQTSNAKTSLQLVKFTRSEIILGREKPAASAEVRAVPGAVSCVGGKLAVSREGAPHPTVTQPHGHHA